MAVPKRRSPPAWIAMAAALAVGVAGCISPEAARLTNGAHSAQIAAAEMTEDEQTAKFQRDRTSILAMAGDYHVTFDFIETVSFQDDYVIAPPKVSRAREVVRVIEDKGDFISLQHILVMAQDGASFPIKHWRQDWQYEPDRMLVFIGANAWEWRDVPTAERKGKWSQTVYQVDDAPRYGALAAWTYEFGVASWSPAHEWRPLPRRDMTTRNNYHAINAVNRHVITPLGWVHEQDNDKLVLSSGKPEILAREIGVNTYERDSSFDVSAATDYWAATETFWAGIREEWAIIAAQNESFGLTIQGETEPLYLPLLALADDVAAGRISASQADLQARAILRSFVTFDLAPLAERVSQTPQVGSAS